MAKKVDVLNVVAVGVSKTEGLKKQVNVAQIKEVINCLFDYLWLHDLDSSMVNALQNAAVLRSRKKADKKLAKMTRKMKKEA